MNKLKASILSLIVAVVAVMAVGCGSSAYEIAVRHGFEGTEEQWLMSLNGKDGNDGASLNIRDVYNEAVKNGFEGDYLAFLDEYLVLDESVDDTSGINLALRSAVLVYCEFTKPSTYWQTSSKFAQGGAGVIYKLDKSQKTAYILTNFHVVYSSSGSTADKISDTIRITPYGGDKINATYVGGSAQYDIAILKAESDYFASEFPLAATLSQSSHASVGQTAIAIGNPEGEGISVTKGIVSVDSENIVMDSIDGSTSDVTMRVIRIDTAVNSGNSGGGLFDCHGELLGIVNAKSSDTSVENMAYAIPVSVASAVADKIIAGGSFVKGTIGIQTVVSSSKAYLDTDGSIAIAETVIVYSVSGAATGKLEKDDVIKSITLGDRTVNVTRSYMVSDLMLRSLPGDVVTLHVARGDTELDVTVTCS